MNNPDRDWMYARLVNGFINPKFIDGVEKFVEFSKRHPQCMDGEKLRCPCNHRKCRNKNLLDEYTVMTHLGTYGFVPNYYRWYHHGESYIPPPSANDHREEPVGETRNSQTHDGFQDMVFDVARPSYDGNLEEDPNPTTQNLYNLLKASQQEVWKGNPHGHSQLSAVARLLNLKAEHHFSESLYDELCKFLSELMPTDNVMADSFYSTKKMMRGLGLPVEKIDCCKNGCMIYWREDSELVNCKFCTHPRFKISRHQRSKKNVPYKKMYYFPLTPRLQRLYASDATAKHMRWHSEHERDGVMRHCSDSPAWKHFDETNPSFASEVRNVRLGLSTDGFQPFGQSGQQYSSWPVIITPYNLPPWMCMKEEYMFLSVIIPGPKNPKQKIDVFLQPLIAELKDLWDMGVQTYDVSSKINFQMRVALMWTISDFPAYSMLSGWSTAGKLACPYCMRDSDSFTLTNGRKTSWFDNHRKFLPPGHSWRRNKRWFKKGQVIHKSVCTSQSGIEILREIENLGLKKVTELGSEAINAKISKNSLSGWKKRSIFWDLPYWKTNLIRHNLDVMHIEKNVFDNIFNTVMNVQGKTKDNAKSIPDDVWASWKEYWSSDNWLEKSRIASQNRASETGGVGTGPSKHTGGSRSTVEHTIELAIELRRPANSWDIFKKVHVKKDGTFVDIKSKRLSDEMEAAMAAAGISASSENSQENNDVNRLYYDLVGGEKKRRVYGLGSQAMAMYQDCNYATSRNLNVPDHAAEKRIKLLEDEVLHMRENQERILQQRVETEVHQRVQLEVQQRVQQEVSLLKQQSDEKFQSMEERWTRMMKDMVLSSSIPGDPTLANKDSPNA